MEETKFDDPNLLRLPLPNEPTNLIERLMKRISQENTKEEIRLNLQMIHEHTLTLFDGQGDSESYHSAAGSKESSYIIDNNNQKKNGIKVCDACAQPVVDPPFYSCLVCNFSLHKWCSELPSKVQVPYHPHLLNLQVKNHPRSHGFFRCSNCCRMSNGFRFQCDDCDDFCVDVVCASLPNSILHEAHDHLLFQTWDCDGQRCISCEGRLVGPVFGCRTCNFNLDLACALLPRTITHRFEKHPFNLSYAPMENGPDEYYCKFCEEEIYPTRWFYHCHKCDQSACLTCVDIEKNLNATFKVGLGRKNYDYNLNGHSHPLTLTVMQITKHLGLLCHKCRMPLINLPKCYYRRRLMPLDNLTYNLPYYYYHVNKFALTCAVCNTMFHPACADDCFWMV